MFFKYPVYVNAFLTEKFTTCTTVILNIFEIKFGFTIWVLTIKRLVSPYYQSFSLRFCGKIKGTMLTRVGFVQVDTSGQIAPQNLYISRCCSLVHRSVPVHVDVQRRDAVFKQDPNHTVEPFVTCPVQRSVPSIFACIHWFNEWIFFLFIVNRGLLLVLLQCTFRVNQIIMQIFFSCSTLDQNSDHIFIPITSSPEKWTPSFWAFKC
jgi:hypothetical protein